MTLVLIGLGAALIILTWQMLRLRAARKETLRALESARAATRAKDEFLATVTHELRTPLNGILGMANLLRETSLDRRQREYADLAVASGEHLMTLVNDLLDLSKAEAGRISIDERPFDLRATVGVVARTIELRAAGKELRIEMDYPAEAPQWVRGDETRVRQVLLNLASNAEKFTESGYVRISVRCSEAVDEAARFRVTVEDTGIGLREETLPQLFQKFGQADRSIARRFGGTGLGLAISKRLVELMGGEIGAEGVDGRGSRFWFELRLPLARPVRPHSTGPRARFSGMRALVAEDNAIARRLAERLLERLGIEPLVVTNGREAVEAFARGSFDLVLMDRSMPEMDGIEAVRAIRGLPRGATVPVIALTANVAEADRAACRDAGMDDVLAKPVDLVEFESLIARWLAPAGRGTDVALAAAGR